MPPQRRSPSPPPGAIAAVWDWAAPAPPSEPAGRRPGANRPGATGAAPAGATPEEKAEELLARLESSRRLESAILKSGLQEEEELASLARSIDAPASAPGSSDAARCDSRRGREGRRRAALLRDGAADPKRILAGAETEKHALGGAKEAKEAQEPEESEEKGTLEEERRAREEALWKEKTEDEQRRREKYAVSLGALLGEFKLGTRTHLEWYIK